MILSRISRIKNLIAFIAVLILFIQILPNQKTQTLSNQGTPEWNTDQNIAVTVLPNNLSQNNLIRHNQEINLSPANYFYDKYDITPIEDFTNTKKIYGGGFSYLQRYSRFLTVVFSTST